MADIWYSKAGDFPLPDKTLTRRIVSPLRETVEAFVSNVGRVHQFWLFQPRLVDHACVNMAILFEAAFLETGHVPITEAESQDAELQKRVFDRVKIVTEQRYGDGLTIRRRDGRALERFDDLSQKLPDWQPAIHAALTSQLLGIWTAFEALSSDIWTEAVNSRPRLVLQWTRADTRNQEKSIPLSTIQRADFDLRECMGTIFRDTGKVSFMSLATTKEAYKKVFGELPAGLLDNPQLRILELVRNLLAHKAGRVDDTFREAIKDLPHAFGDLAGKKELDLNGEIARDLSTTAINQGVQLIEFVHGWLQANP